MSDIQRLLKRKYNFVCRRGENGYSDKCFWTYLIPMTNNCEFHSCKIHYRIRFMGRMNFRRPKCRRRVLVWMPTSWRRCQQDQAWTQPHRSVWRKGQLRTKGRSRTTPKMDRLMDCLWRKNTRRTYRRYISVDHDGYLDLGWYHNFSICVQICGGKWR